MDIICELLVWLPGRLLWAPGKCDRLAMSASPCPGGSGTQATILSLNRSRPTLLQAGRSSPGLLWGPTCPAPRPEPAVCPRYLYALESVSPAGA